MNKKQIMQYVHCIIAFILVCSVICQQQAPITSLQLNKLLKISQVQSGYSYYAVSFQVGSKDSQKLLLVTAETQQFDSIGMYTSVYYDGVEGYFKHPNYENSSSACSYASIDTCAIMLPQVGEGKTLNLTVYLGVQLFFTNNFTLFASIQQKLPGRVGVEYSIDFSAKQSGIITLSSEQVNKYEQVIVQMEYDSLKSSGRFSLYAGIDKIPTNNQDRIGSKLMGAFTQILVLQPLGDNSTYYILLQGQMGTQFDLSIKPFSTSSPKLEINSTVFYYSTSNSQDDGNNFQLSINYQNQEQVMPLFVDLKSLGGYGQFEIDYCDGLMNFTFSNLNGQSAQLIIPVGQRKQCYDTIYNQGGLMIQNIIVSIRNVAWYFSYSIGVFEGDYPLEIAPYNEKLGTLIKQQTFRVYAIQNYINQSFVLKYKTISGEQQLNFTLLECKINILSFTICTKILNSNENPTVDDVSPQYSSFNFTCLQKKFYKLQISHNSDQKLDSQYVLLLLPLNPKATILAPSRPVYSIIQKNQYQYYIVNISLIEKLSNIKINNKTNILITMTQTNGQCLLLTSLVKENPKYEQVFQPNSTVDYNWNGKRQYSVNPDTQAIYVAVLGSTESLYHLQVTISTNEDIPQSYVKLLGDKLLYFTLSSQQKQDHILLSYSAHSIPYSFIISPTPSCVVYSYSLPITNKTCRKLPYQLIQKNIYVKIYRNLSEQINNQDDDKDYKFMVYVYSGSYYLFQHTPVLVACQDTCYEYVTVYVPDKIRIVHKGMGYVAYKDSTQTFSNQKMELTCENSYPCFLTINASLPFGGDMQLFYESANIQQIEWMTKPLTFQLAYDPKYFYMQIRSWSSLNTAIFYTEGISVTIYYNIYSMRQNATNAMQYGFPNSYSYMKKSQGNPLRRFHIVEFDQKLIEKLGCKDQNDICIATLSVYPNTNAEYSTGYIKDSIGYFSCNTFSYYIPMNSPYMLSQQYSLIYFTHQLTEDEISNIAPFYYVKIQPLSNCRPQIFAPFSSNSDNPNASINNDMPFYGNFKIDSRSLDLRNPQIQFTISTDTPCEYMIWLLNNDVQPVMENVNYELVSDQNGTILLVFNDKYLWDNRNFTINFQQPMNQISISKYETYKNGSIKFPTVSSALAFSTQSKQLSYVSPDFTQSLYLIKASTASNIKAFMKISTYDSDTILLTNERMRFAFNQVSSQVRYLYFSNNDFLMFVTADSGEVRLTVEDFKRNGDRYVVETYINEKSSPWVKVNAVGGDIREYIITLQNVLFKTQNNNRNLQQSTGYPKISLHIQQTGTIGLPKLYDGVALFDAFYQEDAQNCYKYITEAIVGRPSLTVDLIFGSQFMNEVPRINSRSTLIDGGRLNSTWSKLPTGYRLMTEFYGNQVYQFCFSINDQPQLVSKQFYVMVQNIEYSLKHLTLDFPMSSDNPMFYEIYEYVATENQNVMIEVVNCFGKSTLLGAKQYSDIYLGQVSELGSFYRDETLSVAVKALDMGYFYFGIKLSDYKDRYKIRVQLLEQGQKLHYDKFELRQKIITKVKSVQQNGKKAVRVHLPTVSFKNISPQVKVHHITYNLFVDNLRDSQQYSSNVIAKCPILGNRNMSSYRFTQKLAQSVKIQGNASDEVVIDVPMSQVPQLFNLTGYAQISITEPYTQTLTYYYESTQFKLKTTNQGSGVGVFTVIFILIMTIVSLVIVYMVYKRWKDRQQKAKIAFEMSTYNQENTDQNNTAEQSRNAKQNISTTSSPTRPLKRPLNQNVGYGQFIDESL